ncbi:HdeD family acid-resistance protein [Bifidobacterium crudilactis]|jgi:uncharacterized membrane protein HdeD (DUF308 family)|uniref:HdeD family acid-resistance protein n=1 Tax=Bifidobacterium crudilactis TaxID=327277 RepID=UPI002352C4E3|nr:DUF308 domain-containing protein [Bifidobacterium crudilactis]MCI2149560.1 DUF308 domain-containing protein [Bifidobacterium crudilactis]MCI2158584.1 DUF308 domain-containing protein [Bifidobacterium crudilactis]
MTKKINWDYFFVGILFIITALVSFSNPASNLVALVYGFAILAIIKGVSELTLRRRIDEFTGAKNVYILVLGIVDILLGVFLIFNASVGVIALPYIFAIWFILDSIFELAVASVYRNTAGNYYWFDIVMNVLGIVLGIILLFNPVSSALTLAFLVGAYFLFSGISYLAAAF